MPQSISAAPGAAVGCGSHRGRPRRGAWAGNRAERPSLVQGASRRLRRTPDRGRSRLPDAYQSAPSCDGRRADAGAGHQGNGRPADPAAGSGGRPARSRPAGDALQCVSGSTVTSLWRQEVKSASRPFRTLKVHRLALQSGHRRVAPLWLLWVGSRHSSHGGSTEAMRQYRT